ncbi:unnamed protein product [Fraxinus pennsylvanica]|uniref:Mediator-associated protein 2 n=1 Tax=Fraxinus pennsylvanica TaxID=56036 RepID=A0AAD1YQ88_9LAMI|nr:unnamed protein product [Fraxinus pennsylvanica]
MDVSGEARYKPTSEFEEDKKDPLVELNLTDSTELWLIQWPINQAPDFDGQELSLKLHRDGHLGSFDGSSGKSYEVVSFKSQDPEATVFLSSASESKIAGKISRRVSLVHYPEPSELQKHNSSNLKEMSQSLKREDVLIESSKSTGLSAQDSGRGNSAVTSTGSLDHSDKRKSKKQKKSEV